MRTYQNIGINGQSHNPPVNQIAVGSYTRNYQNAPNKVGNLSRSKHLQHISEAIETVHGEIAYPIQRFSRRMKRGLKTKTI